MIARLTKRSDFVRLNQQGKRWVTPYFVVQMAENDADQLRVGFTVTKKQGNAVVRNRIKRRLRELAEAVLSQEGMTGHDYVLIGREAARTARFAELESKLRWALGHVHREAKT